MISLRECIGCEIIRTDDEDEWDEEKKKLNLVLDAGTSDLMVFVHTAQHVSINLGSSLELRKITRNELE